MEDLKCYIELEDKEWERMGEQNDRHCARAIVVDDLRQFYFVQITRDDLFGKGTYIETAGGGLEENENTEEAVLREVKEELGIESELLCKIGIVSDYYHAVNRHNINHYYLCKMKNRGEQELLDYEKNDFQMKVLTLGYEEAVKLYEQQTDKKLGRLLTNRELPILKVAKQWLDGQKRER